MAKEKTETIIPTEAEPATVRVVAARTPSVGYHPIIGRVDRGQIYAVAVDVAAGLVGRGFDPASEADRKRIETEIKRQADAAKAIAAPAPEKQDETPSV